MYYFSKANTLLGMHSNKAIVVIMAVIYCFIAKLPQDYNLKMVYYYSQQFEYSLQSTYWNSAAIVMYSKMELKEEILWCRRGWCGRSNYCKNKLAPCKFSCSHPLSWVSSLTLWHQVTMQEAGLQTQSVILDSSSSGTLRHQFHFNLWYSIMAAECRLRYNIS